MQIVIELSEEDYNHIDDCILGVYGDAIKNGTPLQWIPVNERLPEKNRDVYWVTIDLIKYNCHEDFVLGKATFENGEWWGIESPYGYGLYDKKVVAWMPCIEPEPWKEEE